MMRVGEPKALKLEDGTILNLNDRITDRLYDNVRVWVLFEDFSQSPEKKNEKNGKRVLRKP